MKPAMHHNHILMSAAVALALLGPGCGSANPAPDAGLADAARQAAQDTGPSVRVAADAHLPTPSSVADLVDRVSPSVVNINTVHHLSGHEGAPNPFEFFFPEGMPQAPRERKGAGTGFIIDPSGYVMTNAHVVQGADEVTVLTKDDQSFRAHVVGRDRKLDLALLKIEGAKGLPSVVLGDSEALRVGENVLAVGNPFGLGHSVSMGIVSAKARTIGAGPYDDFIQTDASINPGNSGGPLFNMRGEVVGINTAIRANADGIGFAIPVNALKDIVKQLEDKGFVERGKLGLAFQPVTAELAKALGMDKPYGALVSEIVPGSSAARAGIKSGDIIVAVNGSVIHRSEELPRNVARHAPGSTIDVQLIREKKKMTVKARLDKLEDEDGPPQRPQKQGSRPSRDSMLGIEFEDSANGVRVAGMSRAIEGIEPGDVIVEVNGAKIGTTADLRAALKRTSGDTALFKVKHGNSQRFVGVPLKD
jgi:serine protease Do